MICPSCGTELPSGSRFCLSCGRPAESLTELMTSPAAIARCDLSVSSETIAVGGLSPGRYLPGATGSSACLSMEFIDGEDLVALCAIRAFVFVRIGLVAAIADAFVWSLFESAPPTLQTSAWYASSGFATHAIVGALAVYGFKTAIGKQSLLDGAAIAD
jgi:hypothetical protein